MAGENTPAELQVKPTEPLKGSKPVEKVWASGATSNAETAGTESPEGDSAQHGDCAPESNVMECDAVELINTGDKVDQRDLLDLCTYMQKRFGRKGDPNNSIKQDMAKGRAMYSFSYHILCKSVGLDKEIRF